MTKKELARIAEVLFWYEATDGSEREDAAHEMYIILKDIYKKSKRDEKG